MMSKARDGFDEGSRGCILTGMLGGLLGSDDSSRILLSAADNYYGVVKQSFAFCYVWLVWSSTNVASCFLTF